MFIDSIKLIVSSGNGGAGCSSFRREKFVMKGGPDGGDGGKGGDVSFLVNKNVDTLSWYKGKTILKAKNGSKGMGRRMTGKSSPELILIVPPGTQVIDTNTNEVLLDLVDEKKIKFLEGGKGGLGNFHFKSSRNQRPTYFQPGLPGKTKEIKLELKLIADIGLVGYPNVGKSTFISTISNAKAEAANYEFTTLTPKLGVVEVGEYNSFILADIPGIIDGASKGRGLGIEFLKHIERTKTLLFTIDVSNYKSITEQFLILKEELEKFSIKLSKKNYAIALTKIDAYHKEDLQKDIMSFLEVLKLKRSSSNNFAFDSSYAYFIQDLSINTFDKAKPFFVLPISSIVHVNTKPITYALYELLRQNNG